MNPIDIFCENYGIRDKEKLDNLYEINELILFMPPKPTDFEKQTFVELLGLTGVEGYMDYLKSNNTFELVMQWREKTGNF